MKIGFTGTQDGMTSEQKEIVQTILWNRLETVGVNEFHHGDCIGADVEAAKIAWGYGFHVVTHPPSDPKKRAWFGAPLGVAVETRDPKPYIDRNHDIVDEVEMMIATPKGMTEELRSGTWATIRYALKSGKRIYIVYPDGTTSL